MKASCFAAALGVAMLAAMPAAVWGAPAEAGPAKPRTFESVHEGMFGGHKVRYKAVVAEYFIKDAAGKRTASLIATSYLRTDVPKGAARPVVFVFNGGPGSASLWLHLGLVGPRRVDFPDAVSPPTTPPFHLVDNEESPLDVADIVLFDPPGTGFSRILPDGKPEEFYGVAQDAQTTVDFIEQWVRENDRWNAPKYLLSESYGTIRAAVVARLLAGGPMSTGNMDGVTLNGVILLGQALDFSSTSGDLRYLNELPSLAATACYYHKVNSGCTAEDQVEAARKFSSDVYLRALYAGSALPASERDTVADRLASLIGLPSAYIRQHDLRVSASDFAHALLADRHEEIGTYDGRYVLPAANSGKDPVADDPAMGQYVPGFVAAFNLYVRNELGVSIDDNYEAIAFRTINARWDWGQGPGVQTPPVNYATDLAVAMRRNPRLRLMVGTGYYDLQTTLGTAEYTVAHSGIPSEATEMHLYPSGHMAYLGDDSRKMLARDLRAFLGRQ
jgi:carboxypeptidase C (cathepsin A)